MSKEAMKLALEAAYLAGFSASGEGYNSEYPFGNHARNPEEDAAWIKDRDNALREALAEKPAPPPECQTEAEKTAYAFGWFKALESVRKRPAQQEPKKDLMYSTVAMQERHAAFVDRAVATLEQAKREALAEQPAQQEPVAWAFLNGQYAHIVWGKQRPDDEIHTSPLYTSPPAQRTWVGLTDEEILEAWCIHLDEGDEDEIEEWRHVINEAREIEAKLREKNT